MAEFGFSRNAWWDAIRRGVISPRPRLEPINEVLRRGRRHNRGHLKARLLDAGLKQAVCEPCGLAEWRGQALPLELHHINGDGLDNDLTTCSFSARTVTARPTRGVGETRPRELRCGG